MFKTDYTQRRVLVTGATGFAGQALCRALVAEGAVVRAIARPQSDRSALADLPITWFTGQIYDTDTVKAATEGVEYIFHMATTYRHAGLTLKMNQLVHITGTQLLAEAALAQPGFQRFVHVSTCGVHGHIPLGVRADENAPIQPEDDYQVTKNEAEVWVRGFAASHGLPLTVLRPCALYGDGEKRFLKFFRMAAKPVLPLLGPPGYGIHLIHVDDFTGMARHAGQHPKALGEIFLCGSPEPIALERMARLIADAYGQSIRVFRVPAWPVYEAGRICEWLCKPFGIDPPLHRRRVAFFTKNRSFDTRKVYATLDYTCQVPDATGIPALARWYVEHGWVTLRGRPAPA
jgi:nucleoside-diphosphate-sugar epimerase